MNHADDHSGRADPDDVGARGVELPGRGQVANLAVRLDPAALRHVRRGHPWVFDGSIASVRGGRHGDGTGLAGDLAVVFDDRRRFAAVGLWDPASPIRIRVLHAGSPRAVDASFWSERVDDAIRLRSGLRSDPTTTAWRVLHGEDDHLPGVVVDRYGDVAVVELHSAAWFAHLDGLLDALDRALQPRSVVLRLARSVAAGTVPDGLGDAVLLRGAPPAERVAFREHGLRFTADVRRGQKTGWFLDQRDNRRRVASHAEGARVLDVFCCGGGFTVHAAAAGASHVHSVDLSPHALADTRRHLAANRVVGGVARVRHRGTVGDAFEVMSALDRAGERYDVVVVDPPSFASRQRDVPAATRAYSRLAGLAVRLVQTGGLLVQASCSTRVGADDFERAVRDGARRAGVDLEVRRRTAQPVDHPCTVEERRYLKAVFARVGR